MSAPELISTLEHEGLRLGLDDAGGLRCYGNRAKVNTYLPIIRAHKPELLRILAQRPSVLLSEISAPWDRIRDLTAQGWRAEFGPPDATGRQAITWRAPGTWASTEPDQGESLPKPHSEPEFALVGNQSTTEPVRCADCRHQNKTDHPALIRCGAGVQAPGACGLWWSTDRHRCEQFEKGVQQ